MKPYIVFYGRQVYGEYASCDLLDDLPDGAYILTPSTHWQYVAHRTRHRCLLEDVPQTIRTLALLMGL